jgi:ubiquinone/menaquinone biosynthesis C-methylase UbiE
VIKDLIPDGSEVYFDGINYDAENFTVKDDIPFYIEMAKKAKGPVLEVACGTGRITLPVAKASVDVMGLDFSVAMLARAREKSKKEGLDIRWIKADCRNFNIGQKFNLIYMPFNSMQHLHDRVSIEKMFSCVKKHLSTKGKFIVDVFNPNPHFLDRDNKELFPIGYYKDPHTDKDILVNEQYSYDKAGQSANIIWHYKRGKKPLFSKKLNMRCFFPLELDNLFHYNDFKILNKYGSFERDTFDSESQKQIIVCKAL